jgi:hypothetical protein
MIENKLPFSSSDEFLGHWMRLKFNTSLRPQFVMLIAHLTYDVGKDDVTMSLEKLMDYLPNMAWSTMVNTMQDVVARKVVLVRHNNRKANTYSINLDYDNWIYEVEQ